MRSNGKKGGERMTKIGKEKEINLARSFVNQILDEEKEEYLNYLKEAIDIRLKKEPSEYLENIIRLMEKYNIPHQKIRLINLSIFPSDIDEQEVEQRKKQVTIKIANLKKQREEINKK